MNRMTDDDVTIYHRCERLEEAINRLIRRVEATRDQSYHDDARRGVLPADMHTGAQLDLARDILAEARDAIGRARDEVPPPTQIERDRDDAGRVRAHLRRRCDFDHTDADTRARDAAETLCAALDADGH